MANPRTTLFHYANKENRLAIPGTQLDQPLTATEALEAAGNYDVQLIPSQPYLVNGNEVSSGNYGIVGGPFSGNYVLYGEVKNADFPLMGPRKICDLWDKYVKLPINTIGAVGGGSTFILSSQLGSGNVHGDEHTQNLILINPLDGKNAIQAFVSTTFLWCLNQVKNAIRSASATSKIRHHTNTEEDLIAWLQFLPQRFNEISAVMTEVYDILAQTPVTEEMVTQTHNKVLSVPATPDDVMPDSIYKRHELAYNQQMRAVLEQRQAVNNLFHGELTTRPACNGTAYGLLQAYTEVFQHGGKRLADAEVRSTQNLIGAKSSLNDTAFKAVMELANVQLVV